VTSIASHPLSVIARKVVLVVLCSSIDVDGARSLLFLAYERVGSKRVTSLILLARVNELGLLTLLQQRCLTCLSRKCRERGLERYDHG